jgi:rare lipoprotein A
MPVTGLGRKRPEISRYANLLREGNAVGATLFACCILCAAGHRTFADSRPPQQARELGAIASVKKEVPCNRSGEAPAAGFASLLEVSAASPGGTIVGVASWYNPYVELDETETASGEQYDPDKWTAAIQIDLRDAFGGVGFGKDYRAAYALVESGGKRAIVKINDVGPLRPGRVIDLSERAMRYFDATMELGLVPDVKLTPLRGSDWIAGPTAGDSVKISCEPRDAGRDNSAKRLSTLESGEKQAERDQRQEARIRRDQHRAAAPSSRIDSSDQMVEGRPSRTRVDRLPEGNLTEEAVSGDIPGHARTVRARSGQKARRVEAQYLEEAGQ